jgi:predicted regulator of Ras-like GTPase activity (Roadblock/LC7/MglB family)
LDLLQRSFPKAGVFGFRQGQLLGTQNQQVFELLAAVVSRLHRRSNAVENRIAKARPFAISISGERGRMISCRANSHSLLDFEKKQ